MPAGQHQAPAAPADHRADPGGEWHADHQRERLAAHHPTHGAAALVVGHAGGDLGEHHAHEGAGAAAGHGHPDGDPEEGAGIGLRHHHQTEEEQPGDQQHAPPDPVRRHAADGRGDAPGDRGHRHQVGDQRHADLESVRHRQEERRTCRAARGGGKGTEAGGADQGPRQHTGSGSGRRHQRAATVTAAPATSNDAAVYMV